MSRTLRHRRMLTCPGHDWNHLARRPEALAAWMTSRSECGDCARAMKKWTRVPDGWHFPASEGMRTEKTNERRARRHGERETLRKGWELDSRVYRKWLD